MTYVGSGFQNRSTTTTGSSTTTVTHDAYGRDSVVSNPLSQATTTVYNVLNRVTSVTQPGSAVTSMSVSENTGSHTATVSVTDPRSLVFSSVGNALGWNTSATDPQSNASSLGYDRNGFLRRAVNRASGVVTADYDSLGRAVSVVANGNTTSFGFDAVSAPSSAHWNVGASTESRDSVATDAQGRQTTTDITRGSLTFRLTSFFNAQGDRIKLKVAKPSSGTWADSLEFGTDEFSWPFLRPDFGGGFTTLKYSSQRLIDTIRFNSGLQVVPKKYTSLFRPETVTVRTSTGTRAQYRYTYDLLGRITRVDSGNVHDYYSRVYTYDVRGRLATYADQHHFVSDSTREPCPDFQIECEPMPPWEFTWSHVTVRSATYSPDNSGNRTDGSASLSNDRLSSMTGANSVSYSFTYDNEGRRTAKTASGYSQTYGWNDLGQLTWVKTGSDSVAYGYDAAGRRVRKYRSSTGATTYYLWDGDHLLMELDGSGNRVLRYAYQPGIDQPVAVTTSSGTFYYYLDQEGNVISVWNSSNTKVAEYKYDPYGYLVSSSGSLTQPLRWKGREYDSETGLIYMRARYYDPTVGRFISEDPIGLEGGINPYTFADGEPVNRSDPSGLAWQCDEGYQQGDKKIGNDLCHFYLDVVTSLAPYNYIGFTSGRGAPVGGVGGSISGSAGGGGGGATAVRPVNHAECAGAVANALVTAASDATFVLGVGAVIKYGVLAARSVTLARMFAQGSVQGMAFAARARGRTMIATAGSACGGRLSGSRGG